MATKFAFSIFIGLILTKDLLESEKQLLEECLMRRIGNIFLWEYMCYKLIDDGMICAKQNDLYFVQNPNRKHIGVDLLDALKKKRPSLTVDEFREVGETNERRDILDVLEKYDGDKRFREISLCDRKELYTLCAKYGWKLLAEGLCFDSTSISAISSRITSISNMESSVLEMFRFLSMRGPLLTLLDILKTLEDIQAVEAFNKLTEIIRERGKKMVAKERSLRSTQSIPVFLGDSSHDISIIRNCSFVTQI